MKFLLLSSIHPAHHWNYWKNFYAQRPHLLEQSYSEQKAAIDYEAIGWADYYSHAMTPLGYEVMEINSSCDPLLKAWARENRFTFRQDHWMQDIVLEQIRKFQPAVLFVEDYENFTGQWYQELRQACPSIRLFIGFVESSMPKTGAWHHSDLILSCAVEPTETLRKEGLRVEMIYYAFDPRILQRVQKRDCTIDVSFVGQIARAKKYHFGRERFLEEVVEHVPVQIFSPSADFGFIDQSMFVARMAAYSVTKALRFARFRESTLQRLPGVKKAAKWKSKPMEPVSPKLRSLCKPAVFGLEMFQTLLDSRLTLNFHIDSAPTHASNYRLFEATGIGTCLVTDWKVNLAELFEPDKEVVAYRSDEECVEKIRWLLEHPKEREEIARAGQTRILRDHTFAQRAQQLDQIIRKAL